MSDFKTIHIGKYIRSRVNESNLDSFRICRFMKCSEEELDEIYVSKNLDTEVLLKISKILEYDFFRLYSQHLILHAPQGNRDYSKLSNKKKSVLPQFRKNIYTTELIDFILELIENGEKTRAQVVEDYQIPKTTLFKWIGKKTKNLK